MKILLDAFGGDNSPEEIIKGAVNYVASGGKSEVALVGKQEIIEKIIKDNGYSDKNLSIINADEVITCEEAPTEAFRKKPNSSICVALDTLKNNPEEYGAFVSAGSTGAILTASIFKAGRIKGVSRPALGALMPTTDENKWCMFMDCGANADCKPINLIHFAIMADVYMRRVEGVENPRIGLLSNGVEDKKGNELVHNVLPVLKSLSGINFIGNVEARDIISGLCDIVITDGFSGNVALKSIEGAVNALVTILVKNIKASKKASIGYKFFLKDAFKKTMKSLDYNSRSGAVFLGVNGVVCKAHGSSKAPAITASLYQAEEAVKNDITAEIAERLNTEEVKSIKFE